MLFVCISGFQEFPKVVPSGAAIQDYTFEEVRRTSMNPTATGLVSSEMPAAMPFSEDIGSIDLVLAAMGCPQSPIIGSNQVGLDSLL